MYTHSLSLLYVSIHSSGTDAANLNGGYFCMRCSVLQGRSAEGVGAKDACCFWWVYYVSVVHSLCKESREGTFFPFFFYFFLFSPFVLFFKRFVFCKLVQRVQYWKLKLYRGGCSSFLFLCILPV